MARTIKDPSKPKKAKEPSLPKFWRDITSYQGEGSLVPGRGSPICAKCGLDTVGCATAPYLRSVGSKNPIVTVVFESASRKEDQSDQLACEGSRNGMVRQNVEKIAKELGLDPKDIRYTSLTLCANTQTEKKIEYKTRGNWCRAHLVRDFQAYRPRVIIPVGTAVLGRLSHKSNAQDWAGKMLTYRGWPDDWITEKKYDSGSSFTGPKPKYELESRILMLPIQSPYIVWGAQNPNDIEKWRKHIRIGLELGIHGAKALDYDRPWFRIATTADEIVSGLQEIPDGAVVSYDLETKGLFAFAQNAGIVFAMFRWSGLDGQPHALGFPWLYDGSPISREDVVRIIPEWKRVLYKTKLRGHNISFDLIYTYARLPDVDLVKMTNSLDADSRMMLYALRQSKESLGLELVAYDWCPEMAGYEEEFELLKRREPALLDPAEGQGGHYANVPRDLWSSHLKPYVMGDVEVAYTACEKIGKKLDNAKRYKIPLANPDKLGTFREFEPASRAFMYRNYMVPAQRVLTRMMARGMHVDINELSKQEDQFPKEIKAAREKLRQVDPRVVDWCQQQAATIPDWELDLENRDQLSTILFDILQCPVKRLTDGGEEFFRKELGKKDFSTLPREKQIEYAAIDKFTLNALTAEKPELKPLQDYRKLYKGYTFFVRSMRNIKVKGIDKKDREKEQYLQEDGRVHASFNQAGTRSGRLTCSNPNLQQLQRDSVVKRLYASRFGKTLGAIYCADLSQIELRLLAAACGDPLMVKAYKEGWDLHSLTASKVFNRPYEHFLKDYFGWLQKNGRDKEAKQLEEFRSVAKCVDPSTLVSVDGRIMRIGNLHDGRKPDTFYDIGNKYVQTPAGQTKINKFYSNGVSDRLLVVSRHGIIACSRVHRFSTVDGRLVEAQHLKKTDVLLDTVAFTSTNSSSTEIEINPFKVDGVTSGNFNVKIDDKFAYFLGLFYGDGYSTKQSVAIITGGKESYFSWQDKIAELASELGFSPRIERTVWSDEEKGHSYGEVFFGSTRVSDMLIQLGAVENTDKRSRTLRLPEWLFNASYELRRSFMEGLLDTDGCAARQGSLSVSSKSWGLIQDVAVLLRSMGITHTIDPMWNKTYHKWYFRINITVRDSWKHFNGQLKLPHKAARLKAPRFEYSKETPNKVVQVIPLEPAHLVEINVNHPNHLYYANGLSCRNTTNFLTGYGGGAFGLQTTLAEDGVFLPLEKCEAIVDALFDTYPCLRKHIGLYKRFIMDHACAVSITGRVRIFEDVFSNDKGLVNKALRSGFNHLIQSTASDIMLTCMSVIEFMMRDADLQSILVSTVHDSIVIDALRSELPIVHEICEWVVNNIPEVMAKVMGPDHDLSWLSIVPLEGDCECGLSYGEQRKIVPDKITGQVDWDALLSIKKMA